MEFRLRQDLERIRLNGFALPLGIEPVDRRPPTEGYTVAYNAGEQDDPDTYTFHIVVSHEKIRSVLDVAFDLLPPLVSPIVEIDSYDAYRMVDVFIGREEAPVTREHFIETWREFEPILLDDGAVGAGANSEQPFVEVFIDQWKGISIHVPLDMRETVERMLHGLGLHEVPETWPSSDPDKPFDATIRSILDEGDGDMPTLDDVVLELRRLWNLELNVDPDRNLDEGGRELGLTLWHAGIVVRGTEGDEDQAYMSVWASARSLTELEQLIEQTLQEYPRWTLFECFSVTRVAYDDRPEQLESIEPRRHHAEVHQVEFQELDDEMRHA